MTLRILIRDRQVRGGIFKLFCFLISFALFVCSGLAAYGQEYSRASYELLLAITCAPDLWLAVSEKAQ